MIDLAGEDQPDLLTIFTDITERKASENAIQKRSAELEERVKELTTELSALKRQA